MLNVMGFEIPTPSSTSGGGGGGGGAVTQGTVPWITSDPNTVAALGGIATESTLQDILDEFPIAVPPIPDPVNTRVYTALPFSDTISGPVTDQVLVTPPAGQQIRLRKFHLHADPALGDGVYPVVTVKLGSTTVFTDKFEPGLPYMESFTLLGAADEELTITTTTTAKIYINVRYEIVV